MKEVWVVGETFFEDRDEARNAAFEYGGGEYRSALIFLGELIDACEEL